MRCHIKFIYRKTKNSDLKHIISHLDEYWSKDSILI